MIKADRAAILWDPEKKIWRVRIEVGEEVIKRPCANGKLKRDAADDVLRRLAVDTAHNEGYEIDPATVAISR
jgi:hypothetical protein